MGMEPNQMKHLRLTTAFLVLGIASGLAAHAQATRTWVSGVGDDANPCSRTAPCKTFAGAISKTAAGGEISVLDPGGFGAVTITKSITINGDGTLAGILHSLTTGVIINAGANDRVVLRNLSLHGATNGLNGIRFLAGKHLLIDNCTISGFTTRGIEVSGGAGRVVEIRNTRISRAANIAAAGNNPTGVFVSTTTGLGLAILENVTITGLQTGIEVAANGRAMISNSVISGNVGHGIFANASTAVVNVEGSQLAFNDLVAINAAVSGAQIRLSNNQIYNNSTGIAIAGGATVATTGDNRVFANGASAAPNGGAITQQ
jgi:hypothetical protein